mmetsp:Transcript_61085/g.154665  ORF Transcript_61085/g.154665 Transcript_61085/m.154665 type:complete len:201 (-) Transcript_61085:960-1562(-)
MRSWRCALAAHARPPMPPHPPPPAPRKMLGTPAQQPPLHAAPYPAPPPPAGGLAPGASTAPKAPLQVPPHRSRSPQLREGAWLPSHHHRRTMNRQQVRRLQKAQRREGGQNLKVEGPVLASAGNDRAVPLPEPPQHLSRRPPPTVQAMKSVMARLRTLCRRRRNCCRRRRAGRRPHRSQAACAPRYRKRRPRSPVRAQHP